MAASENSAKNNKHLVTLKIREDYETEVGGSDNHIFVS